MTTRQKAWLSAALIVAGFAALYWKVIGELVMAWSNDGNYSHGFLIPPIAAYFVWERRQKFLAAESRPSALGLVLVFGSLGVLLLGLLGSELFLTRISILGTLTGTLLFLFGWARLRVLAFPLAFLILMIPIPGIIFSQIAFPLQLVASRVGESTLSALSIPVLREGNVLILANTSLEVAEACSGIRSLVSLIALAIVLGYFADPRWWVRTVVALSAVPVAIVTNGARVAGTGIAAHHFGPAAAEGFFHEFSGWLVFLAAFALTLGIQGLITRVMPPAAPTPAAEAAA